MSSSRGSSQPKDQTQVSHIADGFFTVWATREVEACEIHHPLNHWCLCCCLWALSSVLQLAVTRTCRPAGCSPTCTFLESSPSQPGTVFAHPPPSCHSFAQSCPTLCDPMDCSTSAFPVLHHLPEFAQTHVHWVSDAIQPSHPLPSPSPPAFNLSQYQSLFQWISSSHQVAKVLELQHQSFKWIFRVDFL